MQRCLQPSGWAGPQRGMSLGMLTFTVRRETAGSEGREGEQQGLQKAFACTRVLLSFKGGSRLNTCCPAIFSIVALTGGACQPAEKGVLPPHLPPPFHRFADALDDAHAPERLGKFEELLEAAVDMARVPDEYVISPTYDAVRHAP